MKKIIVVIHFIVILCGASSATAQEKGLDTLKVFKTLDSVKTLLEYGKNARALTYINEVIRNEGQNIFYLEAKATLLGNTQRYHEALLCANQMLRIDSTYLSAYHLKTTCLAQQFNYREAIEYSQILLQLAQNQKDTAYEKIAYQNISGYQSKIQDYKGTVATLKVFLQKYPNDMGGLNNMAMALAELGEKQEAEKYLLRVVAIAPDQIYGYTNLGFWNIEMEQYEKAIPYFDKAIAIAPNESIPYNNRGYAKLKLGKKQDALRDINIALQLDPKNSYAWRNRALVYLELKQKAEACRDLEKARSLYFAQSYGNEVNELLKEHCKDK